MQILNFQWFAFFKFAAFESVENSLTYKHTNCSLGLSNYTSKVTKGNNLTAKNRKLTNSDFFEEA